MQTRINFGQLLIYKNITATIKTITIIVHFIFKLFNFTFLVSNTGVGLDVTPILTFYIFPGKFYCVTFIATAITKFRL